MTISEYLENEISSRKRFSEEAFKNGEDMAFSHSNGMIKAFQMVEEMLPTFEHDLTLRELKDFCKIVDDGCETCPFALWDTDEDGEPYMYNCDINAPHYCDVEEITQKVRKASK